MCHPRVRADMVPGPGASKQKNSASEEPTDCATGEAVSFLSERQGNKEFEKGFRKTQLIPGVLGEGTGRELNLRHRIAKLAGKESLIEGTSFRPHLSVHTFS